MKNIRLSERLLVVASFVEQGAVVADIGSDHAYLPTYLVKAGVIQKAIAGEVAKGPFESAVRNIKKEQVVNAIQVRLANGLHAIEEEDAVDTITIAGMGGSLITTILEDGKHKLATVKRIIAQPNLHAVAIRQWAIHNKWLIVNEAIVKEDGKIYEVIVLEKGEAVYSELELLLGPVLLKEKNEVFQEKWKHEISQWHYVLNSLKSAEETELTLTKKAELERQIELVEEVLTS